MATAPQPEFVRDLAAARGGDAGARTRFWTQGHAELQRIATAALARWNGRLAVSPTSLLHDAFVQLAGRDQVTSKDAGYFFVSFATECRRLLVAHHRRNMAEKRGGKMQRVTMPSELLGDGASPIDLIDLHDAIELLATLDAREAQVVDLRVFGKLDVVECAAALGVSPRTVEADWTHARSWLCERLQR